MSKNARHHTVTLKRHPSIAVLIATITLLVLPSLALAHPLGNFTVNRYSRLEVGRTQIRTIYVVDMAEIPTQQERPRIDLDGDGLFRKEEQNAYLAKLLPTLQENLRLTLNGREQQWTLVAHTLRFLEGQAGLPTMRLRIELVADLIASEGEIQAAYRDENFRGRLGWQEVVVRGVDGASLLASTAPAVDISQELTSYPTDLLQSPPAVNQADFQVRLASPGVVAEQPSQLAQSAPADTGSPNATLAPSSDPFAELIRMPGLGPWTLFVALFAAFGWGAAHALSPGHGKTIVGAYLVGSRGTAKHALFLGLTTTITHTAGVFALGLLTLFASRYILPETLFPWLSLLSGLLVIVIGLSMAWGWLRRTPKEHVHAHQDLQGSEHRHDEHHHCDHVHQHAHAMRHTHDGIHYHSHAVPGQEGTPVTWRSLLALGISGGLLPCPSALVVMLGAIALERIALGLVLIVAFSLGLAGVLTAFGLALVCAGKLFASLPESGRLLKVMPVASSLFIMAMGMGITWQALATLL